MLLDYKSLHDGLNQAEINALYSILRKETIFTETLLIGTTGKYGVYNIVDTGIQVVNAIPTGQYTFNFSDGTVGVGVANDEGIVDVDISFDRSSVCDVVITFPPYVVRINYNLSLSADKSIIQKNESVVVTALLTMDGSARSGESLSYSVKHGSTTIDSGTVTTDLNGQATISYVGTGVGDVSVIVSYGSLLQETYELLDAVQYDPGTTGTVNSNWSNTSALSSAISDSTGTTFTNNTANVISVYFNKQGSTSAEFDWSYPLCVEFECISKTNTVYWQFRSTGDANAPNLSNYGTGTYKMLITNGKMEFYVNGNKITAYNYDNTNYAIRLVLAANSSIKFKDFKVYPI